MIENKLNLAEGIADKSLLTPVPEFTPEPTAIPEPPQVSATEVGAIPEPATETAPVETPAPTSIKIDEINSWLGSQNISHSIQSEDELKTIFSSLNELESYKKKADEFSSLKEVHDLVIDEFKKHIEANDPIKQFGSADAYKAELTARALSKGSASEPVKFISSRIAQSDLNSLSDLDVVSLGWQYDAPKFAGKDDDIKKAIMKELGVEDSLLEEYAPGDINLSPDQELKLSRLAVQERDRFNAVKTKVEVPAQRDFDSLINEKITKRGEEIKATQERIAAMKQGWTNEANRLAGLISTVEIVDKGEDGSNVVDFSFEVDAEFKKEIPGMVLNYALQNNLQPTQENVQAVAELVKGVYQLKSRETIFRAYKKEIESKLREQFGKDQHNARPLNTAEAPLKGDLTNEEVVNLAAKSILGIK